MERLIDLGKIMISPYEVKNLKEYEADEELKKLGKNWRVCTYDELLYIWNTGWKLGIKDLMVFDEKDMYKINEKKDIAIYSDSDKSLHFFHIPQDWDSDDMAFNYLFVKDIYK